MYCSWNAKRYKIHEIILWRIWVAHDEVKVIVTIWEEVLATTREGYFWVLALRRAGGDQNKHVTSQRKMVVSCCVFIEGKAFRTRLCSVNEMKISIRIYIVTFKFKIDLTVQLIFRGNENIWISLTDNNKRNETRWLGFVPWCEVCFEQSCR